MKMKNYLQLLLILSVLLLVGLGCGLLGRSESPPTTEANRTSEANKPLSDRAVDETVGRSNTGIPECDEVLNAIEGELNNPDDNFVVKAAKATVLNRTKDSIRESLQQNTGDTTELTKTCREFSAQFDKYKAEQAKKQAQKLSEPGQITQLEKALRRYRRAFSIPFAKIKTLIISFPVLQVRRSCR